MAGAQLDPRKRPQQARARATWEAIVEAAAQLLEAGGLAGFNTNAVAARAGVSIGSVYQYFPGKDALMAALIGREQTRRVEELSALAAGLAGQPIDAVVDALVAGVVAGEAARPRLAACIDHEEARLAIGAVIEDAGQRLDTVLAGVLGAALPGMDEAALRRACRTLRVAVRAVIDDALNVAVPNAAAARVEASAVARRYLRGLVG